MAKKHSSLTNDDLHNPRGILVHSTGSMLVMSQSMSTATASFHFIPNTTDTYTLGNAARAWKELFVSTSSIKFADKGGNVIQTIKASAEGVSFISSSGEVADISGSTISGSKLHIVGDTFIGGDLTLGDAATDSISISADLTSNLTPNADATYDLGSSAQGWNDLHLGSGGVINFNNGDVTLTHASGKFTWGGDGAVEIDFNNHEMTNVDIDGGAIDGTTIGGASAAAATVTTLSATGDVDLGNATSDTITATGRFDSDIVPSTDSARDLGTSALQFAEAHIDTGYIDSLTTTTDVNIDDSGGDGAMDGVVIGAATAAAGTFTTLNTTGLTTIGDASGDTLTINAATINPANIAAGTDNSVVVYNGSTLVTDEIDSRVWGSTLVDTDGSGTNNELATWSDADSLIGEANLTFDGTTFTVTGDISSSAATTASFGKVVTSGSIETSASLYIAKDRAINFDNGDVTLTHSSNLLDIDGGSTRVDKLEIDSANDHIDVSTDMVITAAADITLTPGGANVKPGSDSAIDLGVSGTAFRELFVDAIDLNAQGNISMGGTGRIDLDANDNTSIRASADDVITFEAGGADQVAIADGTFTPSTSDDISLGTTSLQFSDLFLAEGGVINWDNGDATITQTGNLISLEGGNSRVERLEVDGANDYIDVDTDLKIIAAADITLDPGGNNVKPGSDSADSLGVAGTAWSTVYTDNVDLDGQGRIDLDDDQDTSIRASGDDIITFEAAGADQVAFTDGTIEPSTTDDIALGTTSKMFSDLFLGTGGVVNWNNGNATITHAAGSLTVQGADLYLSGSLYVSGSQTFINSTDLNITDKTITIASGSTTSAQINGAGFNFGGAGEDDQTAVGTLRYVHSETALSSSFELISKGLRSVSTVSPFASDGAALGTTALMWSDLFLANAGVINFNNGNMTVTHTAGDLAVGGGTLTVNGGVKVDNFTLDGTELDLSSGDFTVDVAGDVNIDADGGDVTITDDGAHILHINATTISGSATSSGSFAHIAVNSVSASRIEVDSIQGNWTNAGNTVADLGSITTVDINGGTINGITDLAVADGGTGASTLTDGGVLLGSGTSAITATAVLANGELLIGDNSTDPTVATLTGTSNQITVTNGGGSITLSTPQSIDTSADVTFDSLTLDDLTAGRVVFSGADGLLSDDSDFTFATDTLTATKIGAFEAAGAIDFSDENMTNVDIDSGAIDGTAIGASSHTTIKGTTIDATTDFTIDGLVLTADTITNDSNLTMDVAGDLLLDVDGGDVTITDNSAIVATINTTYISGSAASTGSFGRIEVPVGSIHVNSGSATDVAYSFHPTSSHDAPGLFANSDGGSIGVGLQGVEEFRFAAGGTFHADADVVAYSSTVASDMSLKENITDTKYGLDDVMKLRGVDFDWKRDDMGHSVGVVAQEVEAVIPELVKDVVGLRGKFKAVDYNKLVPVLIESIKELKKEIDDLKSN